MARGLSARSTRAFSSSRSAVRRRNAAVEERSLPVKLLVDIREVFAARGVSFMPSAELAAALRPIEDAPWNEIDLSRSKLAYRLKEFGIRTRHNTAGNARRNRVQRPGAGCRSDAWHSNRRGVENPQSVVTITGLGAPVF
jgi:Protein of unknown function (DUF3631)